MSGSTLCWPTKKFSIKVHMNSTVVIYKREFYSLLLYINTYIFYKMKDYVAL